MTRAAEPRPRHRCRKAIHKHTEHLKAEIARWTLVIHRAGLKIE